MWPIMQIGEMMVSVSPWLLLLLFLAGGLGFIKFTVKG